MKIIVGSGNNVKVDAVRETIADYDFLKEAKVERMEVDSSVHKQPKTLEETVRGAINRANRLIPVMRTDPYE